MKNIEVVGYTRCNPALTLESVEGISDLSTLWQVSPTDDTDRTFADALCEYAARVCYASTARMGTAPNFIRNRIREEHVDVIEHVVVAVRGRGPDNGPWRLDDVSRYHNFSLDMNNRWVLSASLRVWREFFSAGRVPDAIPLLKAIAPKVFEDFEYEGHIPVVNLGSPHASANDSLLPRKIGQARVTLLGFMSPIVDPYRVHGQAVFLVEGVSRAFSHQIVRHRLGSYSQVSQRYASLEKGGWSPIIPPKIAENPEAAAKVDEAWGMLEGLYEELRGMGIRKEDARCILPNACETRLVISMNFKAFSHLFWLRAVDKAAQLEIREVTQVMLEMLHHVSPAVFQDHWGVYQEKFVNGV